MSAREFSDQDLLEAVAQCWKAYGWFYDPMTSNDYAIWAAVERSCLMQPIPNACDIEERFGSFEVWEQVESALRPPVPSDDDDLDFERLVHGSGVFPGDEL